MRLLSWRFRGLGSALASTGVDTWYALSGRIAPVYLADAVVELGFIALLAGTNRESIPGSNE